MPHCPLMILDDDPATLEILTYRIHAKLPHVELEAISSPIAALQRLPEHEYGAVVTDYRMPELDGLAFLAEAIAIQPGTPVILMSQYINADLTAMALKAGAFDFLSKPIDTDDLSCVVTMALEVHRLHRTLKAQQLLMARLRDQMAKLERSLQIMVEGSRTLVSHNGGTARSPDDEVCISLDQSLQKLRQRSWLAEEKFKVNSERLEGALVDAQFRAFRRSTESTQSLSSSSL